MVCGNLIGKAIEAVKARLTCGALFQHLGFFVYDLVDGESFLELQDIVRLSSNKKRCEGCEKFGEVAWAPLLQ